LLAVNWVILPSIALNITSDVFCVIILDNNPVITFQMVDSLNMKVIDSKRESINLNDFMYRVAAYFSIEHISAYFQVDDILQEKGDALGNGYYSKWCIHEDSGRYRCFYRSTPKKALIRFDYDSARYLPHDIYKLKEKAE